MAIAQERQPIPYLLTGILLSIAIHIALGFYLGTPEIRISQIPLEVQIIPPSKLAKKRTQIVSEPERAPIVKKAPVTSLKAEKNRAVAREQLKRGDGPDSGKSLRPPESAKSLRPPLGKPQRLRELRLDQGTLLEKFALGGEPQRANSSNQLALPEYQAFSRPAGSGARFLGAPGHADHLPHLPDGDITLLNTKASKYAVFVRRVATRVFSQLRQQGWGSLRAQDILKIRDFSTVRATLSKDGAILSVEIGEVSGSSHFDHILQKAASAGAADPHPPAGAEAKDGNIHFIFKARSWVRLVTNRRTGAPVERRWLLLATGLE